MTSAPMEVNGNPLDLGSMDEAIDYPQEISSLLSCVFCQADLTNTESVQNAKLLLCFHSVCHRCVASWQMNEVKKCPMCLHPNKIDDILENKILQELVEEPNSGENGMCKLHKKQPVVKYCIQCKQAVCTTCIENHPSLLITIDHNIIELSAMPAEAASTMVNFNCSEHPTEKCNVFCEECSTIVCRDCILKGKHKNHPYETDIAQPCRAVKTELCTTLGVRLSYMKEQLNVSENLLKKKVQDSQNEKTELFKQLDDCCDNVVRAIKDKFDSLKSKLSKMVEADLGKFEKHHQENERKIKHLNHMLDVITLLTNHASDNTIMYTRGHFTKCYEALIPANESRLLTNCDVKRTYKLDNMEALFSQLSEYLHKLGNVITVLEDTSNKGGSSQPSSSSVKPNPSPVRLRPTGDLQSPEARESSRRISQDMMLNISETPSAPSVVSWHTPQQPPAKPSSVSQPTPVSQPQPASSNPQLASLLEKTISLTKGPRANPIAPPVTQFSSATISPVRQDPTQSSVIQRSSIPRCPQASRRQSAGTMEDLYTQTQQHGISQQTPQQMMAPQQQPYVLQHTQQTTMVIPPQPGSIPFTPAQTVNHQPTASNFSNQILPPSYAALQSKNQISIIPKKQYPSTSGQQQQQQQQQSLQLQSQQQLRQQLQQQKQQAAESAQLLQQTYGFYLPGGTHNPYPN